MKKFVLVFMMFCFALQADPREDALKRNISQLLPTLDGWCSREKALEFVDLVLEVKPQVYVEIGVFGGASLIPVASALKFLQQGIFIGIDPWDKGECVKYFDPVRDPINYQWWSSLNFNQIHLKFLKAIKANKLTPHCKIIRDTSERAAPQIAAIDILYIDGNFSDEGSLQDVRLYLPKVCSGGYIWMNDTLCDPKQNAIDLLFDDCELIKIIDQGNCMLFQKR